MEEEEVEERTLRARRIEEDFTGVHTQGKSLSAYGAANMQAQDPNFMDDMVGEVKPTKGKKGSKKKSKKKNKNNNDELTEYAQGSNAFDTIDGANDTQAPLKGKKIKKKKRKDKNKNKEDDVIDADVSIAYASSELAAEIPEKGENGKGSST